MKLAQKVEPLGVFVVAMCDLRMEGCTAVNPSPVTIVQVGSDKDQFVVCRSCLQTMIQEGEWSVPQSRIPAKVDFWLDDSLGRPIVAIDVKGAPRTSAVELERWASSLRRNLAAHAALPVSPYFILLVMPAKGYVWANKNASPDALPDYSFELADFCSPGSLIPRENGAEAEEWAERSLRAMLEKQYQPSGLWWSESGLSGFFENSALNLRSNP